MMEHSEKKMKINVYFLIFHFFDKICHMVQYRMMEHSEKSPI